MKYLLLLGFVFGIKGYTSGQTFQPPVSQAITFKGYSGTPVLHIDTSRCIILICDTTSFAEAFLWYSDAQDKQTVRVANTYSLSGFMIRTYYTGIPTNSSSDYYRDDYLYLDDNKKPLPKNIVVWMAMICR